MSSKAVLYNAWFCPFAQRAWIGVLHRKLDINVVEQDPYNKTPEWLRVNPRGLVPALIHNDRSIYESSVLLEYLDEAWPEQESPTVLPPWSQPYQRFQARIWGDHINKKLVPPYYRLLQLKSTAEREEASQQLLKELKYMFDQKEPSTPFYLGDKPGYVDFMLLPYAFRFQVVLRHHRNFSIPKEGFEKYHEWYSNVLQLECVKATLADEAKLIESYQRYADDTVKSEVGDAIRKGSAMP